MNIDAITLKKMTFIYNALNTGWAVSRAQDQNTYIFKKPHLDDKTITLDDYLPSFIEQNFSTNPFKKHKFTNNL